MSRRRLFVIDAMAMAFRNYHAFGARGGLSTSKGQPIAAVYGSLVFILKLIREQKPDYLVAAAESKEKTFRHELYPEYKANRRQMPEDLAAQLPYFFKLFDILRIPVLTQPRMEADDLIGSLAKQLAGPELDCYIVSGDKDFMQLVNHHVFLYRPKKGEEAEIIDEDGVMAKFGCRPDQVVDVLALIGDSSDNIPGVQGIGEKGAAQLIQKYESLDGIYANIDDINNQRQKNGLIANKEKAYLSQKLATIHHEHPLPYTLEQMRCLGDAVLLEDDLLEFANELEFRTIVKQLQEVRAKAPKKLEVEVPQPATTRYQLVNTPALLEKFLRELTAASAFAVDTETTGLDIVADTPIGLSFSWEEGSAFYVPIVDKHLEGLTGRDVIERLKPHLETAGRLKIGHHIKFDFAMLSNVGIELAGPYFDSMVAAHLVDATQRQYGLDACCLRFFNHVKIPTTDLIGTDGSLSMLDVELEKLSHYACEDADFTFRLYRCFLPIIKEQELEQVTNEVEMPLIPVLARMEQTGVFIDAEFLATLSEELSVLEKDLQARIYDLAGEPFNIQSPKQLQVILFEKLKLHELNGGRIKKTKSGLSTDVSVLEQLSSHPLPQTILEYRSVTKLKSTYVDALPQLIRSKTGRLHTSFHQTGTSTGRLSSSDPNLQNIPIRTELGRKIRKAFRPKEDNYVMISADYSQVELRLLAHLSRDENLMAAFHQGEDIHRATAAKIFGVAPEAVTSEQRSQAKAINFGIIYGMGPQRLARETGVKMAEAKEFIQRYFKTYPLIEKYVKDAISFAENHGYSRTMTGRRRPIPELRNGDRLAQNVAINSPVQGSAADLIKLAMVRLQKELDDSKLGARLLLQVHDELLLECPKESAEKVAAIVKKAMEEALSIDVPLLVEVGIGSNWLEAH